MTTQTKNQPSTPHWGYHASDNTLRKDGQRIAYLCTLPDQIAVMAGPITIPQSLEITGALNQHGPNMAKLAKADAKIRQLCGMVNDYAGQLGLGKKVNADDWADAPDANLARIKALTQALTLDITYHSRPFSRLSLPEFIEAGYTGSDDAPEMSAWLENLKRSALL